MAKKLQLSILDQSIIRNGSNAREALQETSQLVRIADKLGYTRYWVSEHHNFPQLAGSTPEVLIAHLAGEAERIRVGSGGIMLPNHSALKMAENFRMLEALFPGRIDLGLGRAPGGDRLTSSILNPSNNFSEREFVQQLYELKGYLSDSNAPDTIHEKVKAIPQIDTQPALWLLSSSGGSASLAAHFGTAMSFAHFINPQGGPQAVSHYKQFFQPSAQLAEPLANVGIFAFCSESEEELADWQLLMDFRMLMIESGSTEPLPPLAEIKTYTFSPAQLARIEWNRNRMVSGKPADIKQKLEQLGKDYDVEEIVLSTMCEDFGHRVRSFELLAEVFEIG